jgi:hypothetical protein
LVVGGWWLVVGGWQKLCCRSSDFAYKRAANRVDRIGRMLNGLISSLQPVETGVAIEEDMSH